MEGTVKIYQEVYRLLDTYSLTDDDCGKLCGKICCCYTDSDDHEAGMELLPGEEEVFDLEAPWHKPRFLSGSVYNYPPKWGDRSGLFQIRCLEPCPRDKRPVNCRLFPFRPYFLQGNYYLILTGKDLLYGCPLISKPGLIKPEFVQNARSACVKLLTMPRFRELVDWDSQHIAREEIRSMIIL